MGSIISALSISQRGIISFVGAGGKTTLMLRMAKELARTDTRILATTSTKIWPPDEEQNHHLIVTKSEQELQDRVEAVFKQSNLVVAASHHCTKTNKLIGFSPEFLDSLWKSGNFHWILVEADGSACKPIKAPADHEPQIPLETRCLIGLIGLSALGKPLNENHAHRMVLLKEITGLMEGESIDVHTIIALVRHKNGLFKNFPARAKTILFLNQADALPRLDAGILIAEQLRLSKSDMPDVVAIGQAARSPAILKTYFKHPAEEQL